MNLDAHQHFWKYDPARYTWITDSMRVLRRDFSPSDLEPELQRAGFEGCVSVQATQSESETAYLLDLARQFDFIRGVVGWVDLQADDVEARLRDWSADDNLVGIRHIVQSEADERFLMRPAFLRGVGKLGELGLTYDLLVYPHQLRVSAEFVRSLPGQRIVIDHLSKPSIASGELEPWRTELGEVARSGDVYCKLSGMVTEADWRHWRQGDFDRYLDAAWEIFGEDRLMIGSDWPVCLVSSGYQQTIEIVQRYLRQFDQRARDKVLGANCASFYGLSI